MRTYIRTISSVALSLLVAACMSEPTDPDDGGGNILPPGGIHVLFIGNSLTYDIPATIVDMAELAGDTVRVQQIAYPDYALIDHYKGPSEARSMIASQPWDFVVLQQGPSTVGVNRDTLILAAQNFNPLIRQKGGKPALYMVWPSNEFRSSFDLVRESYQQAALAVDGVFMPAGEAWRRAWEEQPTLALYDNDGYHPSLLGKYLAALVLYEQITGNDARDLPDTQARVSGMVVNVPATTIAMLQRIAHETNQDY